MNNSFDKSLALYLTMKFKEVLIEYIGEESDLLQFYLHNIRETILYDNNISEFIEANDIFSEQHFVVYSFYIQAFLDVKRMFDYKMNARMHIKKILLKCSDELYVIEAITLDEYIKFKDHANKLSLFSIYDQY
ncbi:hypothetical protein D0T50_05665 [Bacteroides sp. 214]|uniref:hypothetical protein n=1 Tax=Bacteroides sp. 214 TaxID=2302935 RepID=UPI0013CFC93A|nr:hypothetical protein [Bacteroides sp. 214]NDW12376.1 hypothetical protein [Bacteroides sp. 214]